MKALFVNEVCGVTSTGRICTDLAGMLEQRGWECKVAYGRKTVPAQYEKYAVRIGNKMGVYAHVLGSRLFDNTGFYSYFATKKFIRWVEEYDPDVIHLHNLHGYYIHLGVLFDYLHRCGKPIFWTLHDCWTFTGHCSHYDYIGCDKWKTECHDCPMTREYPKSLWWDRSKRNYVDKKKLFTGIDRLSIITPSDWLRQQVEQSFLGEYPVRTITNGIDTDVFNPTYGDFRHKNGLKDKTVLLGVANVWTQRKGRDDFFRLASELDERYRLVLVGDLRGVECPENILHISHTNNPQELAEIYSAADVFLNLTCEDTYPTTNLESLACGTPVITYRTGGSPESVPDCCGRVIDRGDVAAVHKALDEVLSPAFALEANAEDFHKIKRFHEYVTLYEDAVT